MGSRWIWGVIAVVSVAALAGVGFAAYVATATTTVNASGGSFYLSETSTVGSSSLSASSAACAPGTPGSAITLTASNLLPGDFCNFTVTVTDPGSIGGNGPFGVVGACSGPCSQLSIYALWLSPYSALAPASGNSDTFSVLVTDVGSGTVAESDSWTLTVTDTPA
jgi:hypothetical protein